MGELEAFFAQEKKEKLERYRRLNPMAKTGQIVFTGSSLMEQFPISEMVQNLPRPLELAVYNRGIGGYTTTEMMQSLEVMVTDLKPKYLFINIGTNDLNGPDFKMEELIENYRLILLQIQDELPDVKIFMMAYYPVNIEVGEKNPWMKATFKHRNNERVAEANAAVEKLAKKLGHTFIDCNEGITDEKGQMKEEFTIEGMHMYGNGYEKVFQTLLPLLRNLS